MSLVWIPELAVKWLEYGAFPLLPQVLWSPLPSKSTFNVICLNTKWLDLLSRQFAEQLWLTIEAPKGRDLNTVIHNNTGRVRTTQILKLCNSNKRTSSLFTPFPSSPLSYFASPSRNEFETTRQGNA